MVGADMRVGFIGLGDMGAPIASRIIDAGFPTALWARRDASLAPFGQMNFDRAGSPADLGRRSDVVGICVFSDSDVIEVVLGENGVLSTMPEGGVILIHSTVSVDTVRRIADAAVERVVAVLDAPVTGSRLRAIEGKLTIMVGGDAVAYERTAPVMRAYGAHIRHLGPAGSGQAMKFLNNALAAANLALADHAVRIGQGLGLERAAITDLLRVSSGGSFMLELLADAVYPDPAYAARVMSIVKKDIALYAATCARAGLSPSLIDQAAKEAIAALLEICNR